MKRGFSESLVVNLVGFQIAWWVAILLQQHGTIWLLLLLLAHLLFHRDPKHEVLIIFITVIIGFSIDTILLHNNLFHFANSPDIPPLWLAMLWACFAATLRQGLSVLAARLWLASLIGGIAGSGSYLLGAKLGAVELGYPNSTSGLILFVIWAALLPLLLYISRSLTPTEDSSKGLQP